MTLGNNWLFNYQNSMGGDITIMKMLTVLSQQEYSRKKAQRKRTNRLCKKYLFCLITKRAISRMFQQMSMF